MNAARTSTSNHWVSVGRRAKSSGLPLSAALTNKAGVDSLIAQGYYATTPTQLRALVAIAEENAGPFSEGVSPIHSLSGRMVDSYRVAASLIEKGLATRSGDLLRLTDAGRIVVSKAGG